MLQNPRVKWACSLFLSFPLYCRKLSSIIFFLKLLEKIFNKYFHNIPLSFFCYCYAIFFKKLKINFCLSNNKTEFYNSFFLCCEIQVYYLYSVRHFLKIMMIFSFWWARISESILKYSLYGIKMKENPCQKYNQTKSNKRPFYLKQ